jgi:hypothetical protein
MFYINLFHMSLCPTTTVLPWMLMQMIRLQSQLNIAIREVSILPMLTSENLPGQATIFCFASQFYTICWISEHDMVLPIKIFHLLISLEHITFALLVYFFISWSSLLLIFWRTSTVSIPWGSFFLHCFFHL